MKKVSKQVEDKRKTKSRQLSDACEEGKIRKKEGRKN